MDTIRLQVAAPNPPKKKWKSKKKSSTVHNKRANLNNPNATSLLQFHSSIPLAINTKAALPTHLKSINPIKPIKPVKSIN